MGVGYKKEGIFFRGLLKVFLRSSLGLLQGAEEDEN